MLELGQSEPTAVASGPDLGKVGPNICPHRPTHGQTLAPRPKLARCRPTLPPRPKLTPKSANIRSAWARLGRNRANFGQLGQIWGAFDRVPPEFGQVCLRVCQILPENGPNTVQCPPNLVVSRPQFGGQCAKLQLRQLSFRLHAVATPLAPSRRPQRAAPHAWCLKRSWTRSHPSARARPRPPAVF